MVSLEDEGTGNMQDHCPYQWLHRRGQGELSMVSSQDAKEVGNREYHTHSWIRVAFHLRYAAKKEWRVLILSQSDWERNSLIQVFCTLADSELIFLITQPVAMWNDCTK